MSKAVSGLKVDGIVDGFDSLLVDYDKQELILLWRGLQFVLDLKEGDVGDFWHSINLYGDIFDVNFHQEDATQKPTVAIHEVHFNDKVVGVVGDQIDTITEAWTRGDQSNYFDRVLSDDWSIETYVVRHELKVFLWGREYFVHTEDFPHHDDGDGRTVWKIEVHDGREVNKLQDKIIRKIVREFDEF